MKHYGPLLLILPIMRSPATIPSSAPAHLCSVAFPIMFSIIYKYIQIQKGMVGTPYNGYSRCADWGNLVKALMTGTADVQTQEPHAGIVRTPLNGHTRCTHSEKISPIECPKEEGSDFPAIKYQFPNLPFNKAKRLQVQQPNSGLPTLQNINPKSFRNYISTMLNNADVQTMFFVLY